MAEDALVDIVHEGMEVNPERRHAGRGLVQEEVHQHGLAAADLAPDVEAFRGWRRRRPKQAREQARPRTRTVREAGQHAVEARHHLHLRRIALDLSARDQGLVAAPDAHAGPNDPQALPDSPEP